MKKIFSLLFIIFMTTLFLGCENKKINIITSSFFQYDIVKNHIQGSDLVLKNIIEPGKDIHHQENSISISAFKQLKSSDLFIYTSNELDSFLLKNKNNLPSKTLNIYKELFNEDGHYHHEHHHHDDNVEKTYELYGLKFKNILNDEGKNITGSFFINEIKNSLNIVKTLKKYLLDFTGILNEDIKLSIGEKSHSHDEIGVVHMKLIFKDNQNNIIMEEKIAISNFKHDKSHEHEHFINHIKEHAKIHYWTSPKNMIKTSNIIKDELVKIYPDYKNDIEKNARIYNENLEKEINFFKDYLELNKNKINKIIYLGHDAMGAFFLDFNLVDKYVPFQLKNNTTEPTVKEIKKITSLITKEIKYIFKEELEDKDKLFQTIKTQLNRNDLSLIELNSYHNLTKIQFDNNVSYLDLFKNNIKNIKRIIEDAK